VIASQDNHTPCQTQRVTAKDLSRGQIRIPSILRNLVGENEVLIVTEPTDAAISIN